MSISELSSLLKEAETGGLAAIAAARDQAGLGRARAAVLGRKAPLARVRSALSDLDEEQRRELGRRANEVRTRLEGALEQRERAFRAAEESNRWQRERLDVTLPGDEPRLGGLHPLTKTIWEIVDIFSGLGYRVADGPEVELTSYNFDALNFDAQHPSRSEQETYYIGETGEVLLRTHTSPVQMRVMESSEPPVYVVCPGRTYRRDVLDPTHLNSFAQIEGLAVDEGITMADLKGTLQAFARELFGRDLDIRLRPHFFPFTEPSAEMDVLCFVCRGSGCRVCKQEGWIEILGCGMVNVPLLEWAGYDIERYTGFAFGLGAERVAALAHGVPDIRYFYENDLRFLRAFEGVA
jgi:phenylalanyl-tRNA synthetase alpha chain